MVDGFSTTYVPVAGRNRLTAQVVPFAPHSVESLLADLRGTVRKFVKPTQPVGTDWEAGR